MNYDLKHFPVNKLTTAERTLEVHSDFDSRGKDSWLVDDIRQHGVLSPIMVRADGTIEDGYRRVECAKLAGLTMVPGYVVEQAVFGSMQLARNLSLYAKCRLYKARIEAAVADAKATRANAATAARNVRHPDALREPDGGEKTRVELETVLGVNWKTLCRAVRVLSTIDSLRASGKKEDADRADRLTSLFRNRGLAPVVRLLEETSPDVLPMAASAADADDDDAPDCAAWIEESPRDKPAKRELVRAALKPAPQTTKVEPWRTDCFKLLAKLEANLKRQNLLSHTVRDGLTVIERAVQDGHAAA